MDTPDPPQQINRPITIKQQRFADEYLQHGNASRAYRTVYNTKRMAEGTIWTEACLLLQNPKVAKRIAEGRAVTIKARDITLDKLVTMLLEDRDFARKVDNASAAATATMGLAKITGYTVEDRRNDRRALADLDTATLEQLEEALRDDRIDPDQPERQPANRTTQ